MCQTKLDNLNTPAGSPPPSFESSSLPSEVLKSSVCKAAYDLALQTVHTSVFNHSIRVFHYAYHLAATDESILIRPEDIHLIFTACVLHDIGTSPKHDGPQRFEVEGADAAVSFLKSHGIDEPAAKEVWTAIALHTSAGIAERITPLAKTVRIAVLIDFGKSPERSNGISKIDLEKQWPRLSIEKILGDAVVEQAVKAPGKAPPASWPGILYRAHLAEPGWDGVNKAF